MLERQTERKGDKEAYRHTTDKVTERHKYGQKKSKKKCDCV